MLIVGCAGHAGRRITLRAAGITGPTSNRSSRTATEYSVEATDDPFETEP
jgi:hypothetical protein